MSGAADPRAGSMFGPYELIRVLGRGGMGEVYEAEHTVKGWKVAVKLMSESVSSDPVFRERMKREARITDRLQEPHVVPVHDYGEIDGRMFLEMRLIEGTDLDRVLKRYGPLSPPRAVAIITQVASALDAAHAAGVTHRDVKPPNILITRDDFAYLVDFGIASATTEEKLTQLGTAVGTWKYMAPERFTNDAVGYRADIYSLACVLYECLTGSPPYASDSAGVLVSAHMMEPIPEPSTKRSGIPRAFDAVIARGMAKKPEDRYASAGDLARAAHEALSDPDQNRTVTILRRSEESTLPGMKGAALPVQRPRAYPRRRARRPHGPTLAQPSAAPTPLGRTATERATTVRRLGALESGATPAAQAQPMAHRRRRGRRRGRRRPRRHRHLDSRGTRRQPKTQRAQRHPDDNHREHRQDHRHDDDVTVPVDPGPAGAKPAVDPAASGLPARRLQARGQADGRRHRLLQVRAKHRCQWPHGRDLRAVPGSQRAQGRPHRLHGKRHDRQVPRRQGFARHVVA